MIHRIVALTVVLLTAYWLPIDIESIRFGLEHEPKLAAGISLKIFMHLMAIAGLAVDATFGYAFLLGATLQGLIVSVSSLRAIPVHDWWLHKSQLAAPAIDILVRLFWAGFLAARPGRIVGWENAE